TALCCLPNEAPFSQATHPEFLRGCSCRCIIFVNCALGVLHMNMTHGLRCQSSNSTSIVLEWHERAPRYLVECKRASEEWGGRGCRAEHTGCGAPSILVVSQLQPSTDYVFRLHSANTEGQFGDPGPEVIFSTKGE
ncbi:unnamed protein product, partial [Ectocarpus sp. 12 AP-2014]